MRLQSCWEDELIPAARALQAALGEGKGSPSYRELGQIYGASGVAGCYSASDFLVPQSPPPPHLLPKKAFVQDNEESINSRGQGCRGRGHFSSA